MNHVAMVIPGIDRLGGAELQVLQLARGLREREWRVTVIALSGTGGEAGPQLMAMGVGFFSLRSSLGLLGAERDGERRRAERSSVPSCSAAGAPVDGGENRAG